MVRKQGGLIHQNFAANENVVDRCLAQIKKVEPSSRADKLYHITMKTAAYWATFQVLLLAVLIPLKSVM